jgi:hypothetical protein
MKKQLSEFLAALAAEDPTSYIDAIESHVRIFSVSIGARQNLHTGK